MRFPSPSSASESPRRRFELARRETGRTNRSALRRLIRLVIALVLVIVVMDAAGDPKIYQPFFAPAAAVLEPSPLPPGRAAAPPEGAAAETADRLRPAADTVDFARQWVPLLEPPVQEVLTELLAWHRRQRRTDSAMSQPPSDRSAVSEMLQAAHQAAASLQSGIDREERPLAPGAAAGTGGAGDLVTRYRTLLAELAAAAESPESPEGAGWQPTAVQRRLLRGLQIALDESYQRAVVDGAVWSPADRHAFYRNLERAAAADFLSPAADDPVISVGVVPLIQQPAIYRGRAVRLEGTVARAQRVDAEPNPFGVAAYWEVWIRPHDGTDRPVLLYAPDVSVRIAAVGPEASLSRGPEVTAAGIFLKRRLFSAVGGVEQAPVIIGQAFEPAGGFAADGVPRPTPPRATWWLVFAVAALLGIGLAVGLSWQATVAARRSRDLRRRTTHGTLPNWPTARSESEKNE